ncbi:DUF2267 domain-containing protein [Rubrolithibacter danxiaensis]|uniref:DUF2267 domain-containing protein n=1 Tax=Rubrolithibacter danxiaensis TaxID=3390805 RepID=UPI003BF784AC
MATELGASDDMEHAFRVTQAVFHGLRDRITIEESMHLISELPMALKAMYVNEWNISKKRNDSSTLHEFLKEISNETRTAEIDFGSNPKEEAPAVFRVIRNCVSQGEMEHVKGQLTPEIAELMEM